MGKSLITTQVHPVAGESSRRQGSVDNDSRSHPPMRRDKKRSRVLKKLLAYRKGHFPRPAKYILLSILVSFGGFLFGLDTGMIGPITTMPQFTSSLGSLSASLHGFVVASILIPAAVTSFFAGHLADAQGRPRAIAIGTAIFGAGVAIEAAAVKLGMMIAGRVLAGLGEGLFLSSLVVYICEISPPQHRGALASTVQIFVVFGVCVGYFICYGCVNTASSFSWRFPFAFQATVSFLFSFACATLLPHSPSWLDVVGRKDEVDKTWETLGVSRAEIEKDEEMLERIVSNAPAAQTSKQVSWLGVFGRRVWKRTALGAFLMGMQQMSGIDGVLFYAPLLFQQAGLSSSQASFLASGISALLMFLATIPASIYADRWGRRTSTVVGGFGLAACMLIIGALYASDSVHGDHGAGRWVVIALIYLFAIGFCVSWAVAIKVYATEIQPLATRAGATSLAYSSNWIVNWIVAFTTPIFLARSSYGVYFLFGFSTLFTSIVSLLFMPETSGRSLETIDASFDSGVGVTRRISNLITMRKSRETRVATEGADDVELVNIGREATRL